MSSRGLSPFGRRCSCVTTICRSPAPAQPSHNATPATHRCALSFQEHLLMRYVTCSLAHGRMPFDEGVTLEVAKQLAVVQKTPVNQNLARQLLELATAHKSDIDLFGSAALQPPSSSTLFNQRVTRTCRRNHGQETGLVPCHAPPGHSRQSDPECGSSIRSEGILRIEQRPAGRLRGAARRALRRPAGGAARAGRRRRRRFQAGVSCKRAWARQAGGPPPPLLLLLAASLGPFSTLRARTSLLTALPATTTPPHPPLATCQAERKRLEQGKAAPVKRPFVPTDDDDDADSGAVDTAGPSTAAPSSVTRRADHKRAPTSTDRDDTPGGSLLVTARPPARKGGFSTDMWVAACARLSYTRDPCLYRYDVEASPSASVISSASTALGGRSWPHGSGSRQVPAPPALHRHHHRS
jgi:hypothetical protein